MGVTLVYPKKEGRIFSMVGSMASSALLLSIIRSYIKKSITSFITKPSGMTDNVVPRKKTKQNKIKRKSDRKFLPFADPI
jgi:hypothetical protein